MRIKAKQLFLLIGLVSLTSVLILWINKNDALLSDKGNTQKAYLLLLENRLSYVQLTKLDPLDPLFVDSYGNLRSNVRMSNSQLQELINTDTTLPLDINKTLNALSRQLELLNTIDAQESLITQLFAYDPDVDLGELSFEENRTVLVERVNAAIQGINSTVQRAKDTLPTLENVAQDTIGSLTNLRNTLAGNDITQMEQALSVAIADYDQLKESLFSEQLTLIRSDEAVATLTDLTNTLIDIKNYLDTEEE